MFIRIAFEPPATLFVRHLNGIATLSVGRLGKLLLGLASTVLFSDPVGTHVHIFVLSKTLRVLKWDLRFDERNGLAPSGHSLSTGLTRVSPHSLCVGKSME
jgi:membrane-associated phospholipid phosphatase